jgi:putative hydrolase of the HAD superfamily
VHPYILHEIHTCGHGKNHEFAAILREIGKQQKRLQNLFMKFLYDHELAPFRRIENWIFDLDNTLYPSRCDLFAQIDARMTAFIARLFEIEHDQARLIQKDYYYKYGTTLNGLMKLHNVPPEQFLEYVHDIDLSVLPKAPELGRTLSHLPGRKFIFTNGSRQHAERVASQLGILQRFDDVFDIAASAYIPKPQPEAYARFLERHGVQPRISAMFEDLPHNLENPHTLGMATVLVQSIYDDHPCQKLVENAYDLPPHIHHVTDDLTFFLQKILAFTTPSC